MKDDKDVMITICGFAHAPSYQILRDGTRVMTFDPTKLKLDESEPPETVKLVEPNPNPAGNEHGLSRPEF